MRLIFDTETTGFPQDSRDLNDPSQPHMAQIGMLLLDDKDNLAAQLDLIVRADDFLIPDDVALIHGITTARSQLYGISAKAIANTLDSFFCNATELLAYNISFDVKILKYFFTRHLERERTNRLITMFNGVRKIDVMKLATPICKMPPTERMMAAGMSGFKTPKLGEAYKILTGKELVGAHSALIDCQATHEIYKFIKSSQLQTAA